MLYPTLVLSFIQIFIFISNVRSELSSVFFYPVNKEATQTNRIPKVTEVDAIALYAHTIQSSKRLSKIADSFKHSFAHLLNTFVSPTYEPHHHIMIWVPEIHHGDVKFPKTMTLQHSKSIQDLYNIIGNERKKEFGIDVEQVQNLTVKDLVKVDLKKLPEDGSPLFKLIRINDVSEFSLDYTEKVEHIQAWIHDSQAKYPKLSFTLLTRDTSLRRRDLTLNCYKSLDQCNAETNTCHGQGTCVPYLKCYRCKCNEGYGGNECMYKDWSSIIFLCGSVTITGIIFIGIALIFLFTAATPSHTGMSSNIRAD
ncbi:hypothetical protein HMI54_008149 [Coelomomyces lativittatus]|nr:hypothetical protein HMI56_001029 [Coelomomyces lativittatus]KAJ1515983.1 hypothetical protein HMI55_003179 [Coelomomyces lativittatus]KAJ1516798.1 hypothetical protein HMI54_008149 [Coelomomyces lativittatus]